MAAAVDFLTAQQEKKQVWQALTVVSPSKLGTPRISCCLYDILVGIPGAALQRPERISKHMQLCA
jgi:hypothetical protein